MSCKILNHSVMITLLLTFRTRTRPDLHYLKACAFKPLCSPLQKATFCYYSTLVKWVTGFSTWDPVLRMQLRVLILWRSGLTSQTEKQRFSMLLVLFSLSTLLFIDTWLLAMACYKHITTFWFMEIHLNTKLSFIFILFLAISFTYHSLYSIKANIILSLKVYENIYVSRWMWLWWTGMETFSLMAQPPLLAKSLPGIYWSTILS